jgi:cell wall-associated NlpC family hydrolase
MTPFFSTPDRIAALRAAAQRWQGTPFAPAAAVCGPRGGACCHRLVIAGLAEAGFPINQADVPDGVLNRATHHSGSQMADWLRDNPARFQEITPAALDGVQPGDLLLLRLGIGAHHAALALDRREVLQTWQGIGAHIAQLADRRTAKRLLAVFRPLSS